MSLCLQSDFKLYAIYVIESFSCEGNKKRGTCFSISASLLLTAYHTIFAAKELKVYLSSDDFIEGRFISATCISFDEKLDVAILKIECIKSKFIDLYSTSIGLDNEVQICGYPVEKKHYHAAIQVRITNIFEHMVSKEFSFEVSQSNIVTHYQGMSGSPVLYKGYCIGILLVQQAKNTLYFVSIKDILKIEELNNVISKECIEIKLQDGVFYDSPKHPISPFEYVVNCNKEHPSIKGINIGFTLKQWNIDDFVGTVYDWLIDYCLSHKDQENFKGGGRVLFKYARSKYPANDLNVLGDLCLHIAIRESCKTIPIMNKVFDVNNKVFSCTHAVLNFEMIELWIGASSVSKNIKDAVDSAIKSVKYIISIASLKNRLITLTTEIHESWPHKDKLKRLADSSLSLEKRIDKIIIPVFIMHDSDLINKYDSDLFLHLFSLEVGRLRELIKNGVDEKVISLIDLRVFYFPVSDVDVLNSALIKELNT